MTMNKLEYKNIDELLYTGQLPNGLQVMVVPKRGFGSFYAVFATNYGGAHRRFMLDGEMKDTPAGVAHFLEHKMFDMPDGDNALEMLSANGADPNAFTSNCMTAYYFSCTENFEENLKLLLHFVSTPYFTEDTVEKEKGIIAQEILMGDDSPGTALYYNLLKLLFRSHPVRDKVAGTVESIAEITAQTLYDCHRAFYSPGNMVLCVEGDVDAQRIMDIAREVLGDEKRSVPQAELGEDEGEEPAESRFVAHMPVSAPQFLIGAKFTPEKEGLDRLRQAITAQLALRLLVGRASPFYTRLYAEGLLNRSFDYEMDYAAGTAHVLLGGESRDADRVLEEFCAEVEKVSREGFDEKAFELARRASYGARLRGLEDFDTVCVDMAESFFDGYLSFESMGVFWQVTKAECESFVRHKLKRERLAISIVESGGEGDE